MIRIWKYLIILLLFAYTITSSVSVVHAVSSCPQDDPCKDKGDIYEKINCYSSVVNSCSSQRQNMASQITYLTTKIELTNTKIISTREKIKKLESELEKITTRIDGLDNSLTQITGNFIERIKSSYKYSQIPIINILISGNNFSDLWKRYKYLQTVKNHDKKLLIQLQNSKVNYQEQKDLKEVKKTELDEANIQLEKEEVLLDSQKREKEVFLNVTKNSEKIYKQNLEAAQREVTEIEKAASVLSQAGVSKRVGRGEVVGIMGNTGFSTGPHLHFAVYNLNESDLDKFNFEEHYQNPFDYVSSRSVTFAANSCDDVGSRQEKSVGGGSWSWPMDNPMITQCFGHTPFSGAYYRSGIHNGVDMVDDGNPLVKAVESGNAYTYRGGQSAGNGVFIFHDNGKMTLYWHLQ